MSKSLKKGQFNWMWNVLLFFFISWVSLYPSLILGYLFFTQIKLDLSSLSNILLLISFFISNYFLILFLSLGITLLAITIIDLKNPPKLGSFDYLISNSDVKAWRVKNTLRTFSRWFWELPNINAFRVFFLRRMGIKIGKHVRLGKYILEDNFLEIGDGTFMGKYTILSGHLIDHLKLTLSKTKIGKNCILGNWVGAVGASIGDNSILLGTLRNTSAVLKGIYCKENGIYMGIPVRKVGYSTDLSPKKIKNLKKMIKNQERINFYESTLSNIKTNRLKFKVRLILGKIFITSGAASSLFFINFLCYYLINSLGFPTGDFIKDSFFIMLIPIFFVVSLGFFIAGAGVITRFLMELYRVFGFKIKEGEYNLDDPKLKTWKILYLWKQFSIYLAHQTPLGYGDSILFQSYLCDINKNVQMLKALVDPEFLEINKNSQCAVFSIIRSHYVDNDKLIFKRTKIGKNVIIGSFAYIGAGAKIGDNTIIAVGAYIPEDTICEPNSLYVGNPARRLPISAITDLHRNSIKIVE